MSELAKPALQQVPWHWTPSANFPGWSTISSRLNAQDSVSQVLKVQRLMTRQSTSFQHLAVLAHVHSQTDARTGELSPAVVSNGDGAALSVVETVL